MDAAAGILLGDGAGIAAAGAAITVTGTVMGAAAITGAAGAIGVVAVEGAVTRQETLLVRSGSGKAGTNGCLPRSEDMKDMKHDVATDATMKKLSKYNLARQTSKHSPRVMTRVCASAV